MHTHTHTHTHTHIFGLCPSPPPPPKDFSVFLSQTCAHTQTLSLSPSLSLIYHTYTHKHARSSEDWNAERWEQSCSKRPLNHHATDISSKQHQHHPQTQYSSVLVTEYSPVFGLFHGQCSTIQHGYHHPLLQHGTLSCYCHHRINCPVTAIQNNCPVTSARDCCAVTPAAESVVLLLPTQNRLCCYFRHRIHCPVRPITEFLLCYFRHRIGRCLLPITEIIPWPVTSSTESSFVLLLPSQNHCCPVLSIAESSLVLLLASHNLLSCSLHHRTIPCPVTSVTESHRSVEAAPQGLASPFSFTC